MQSHPLISVLVANYNNGCYLQEAIDSIKRQKYDNWEIIIVDDDSSDNSEIIYDELKNECRIRVFRNDVNRGVGYTKRRCVENASGEICGFLDPDDVLVGEDALSIMVQKHLENPGASMIYSGMYRGDEHLKIIRESPGADIEKGSSGLEMRSWPFHHFLTFKMSFYRKTEGIDSFMRNAEDYGLYYKLEEVGEVIHLDMMQYIQRNNPNSISLNANSYKAAVWHSYACIKAMKRRGLMDESLMLFPVESALNKAYRKGYDKATSSRVYRLGLFFAKPVLFLAKLWRR